MNIEEARLKTFKNTLCITEQLKTKLALYGFYFNRCLNVLQCYSCNVKIDSWLATDDALKLHYNHSPNCRFLLQLDKSNVPMLEGFKLPKKEPDVCGSIWCNSEANEVYRQNSFVNWSGVKSSKELAEAGFISCNRGDLVMCWSCKVVIGDWECTDIPWVEHWKFSPNCEFVQKNLDKIKSRLNMTLAYANLCKISA